MKTQLAALLILVLLAVADGHAEQSGFPGRAMFPDVAVIELDELAQRINEVSVVDVRTEYEYKTLRIKDALNIALDDPHFSNNITEMYKKNPRPVVVYCNGRRCLKSYKAVREILKLTDIRDVYSFDAGIFEWATAHPDRAVLLGKSPIDVRDLIDEKELLAHFLEPERFRSLADKSAIILDVRSRMQRAGSGLFGIHDNRVDLDDTQLLDKYIQQAKRENKPLLIYDAVGKQVQWLQYHLKSRGLSNYYFMRGGADAYYKVL